MQRVVATRPGAAVHRTVAARLDTAPIMKATGGRVALAVGAVPVVVLTTTGARSGQRRETPLAYFTDGDDVILTVSRNATAAPGTLAGITTCSAIRNASCTWAARGAVVARETEGGERDRICTRR